MADPVLVCVVCGAPITGAPHHANPYEKVRKKAPCCSEACAGLYNPDLHWLPAVFPPAPDDKTHARLLLRTRNRLIVGELPRTVIREALHGGILPSVLRLNLREIVSARDVAVDKEEAKAARKTILSFFGSLFTGQMRMTESSLAQFDAARVAEAIDDLDRWERATAPK